jgi:ABC-2 type transport system ATP-binding protein
MPRDELQRTVLRYRVQVPDGWQAPDDLRAAGAVRSRTGREVQWTLVGDRRELAERIARAGAQLREISPLTLEDAALAFLPEEVAR